MTGGGKLMTGEIRTLQSRLSELALIHPWIDSLTLRYGIPQDKGFAMKLCLEEVLSNVILHGYAGHAEHFITVEFTNPKDGYFVFVVNDEAPPFNPVDAPELPVLDPVDVNRIGGQGIRLLRHFADTLEYRATPSGNQLFIGFSTASSGIRKSR